MRFISGLRTGLLAGCLVLLLWPSQGWGAIARVGSPVGNNVNATTLTLTYSPTAGNFLAVWIVYLNATQVVTSVTDNGATGGSTYVSAFSDAAWGGNWNTALYYTLSAKSGVTTITVTVPVSGAIVGIVQEYSGVGAIDKVSTQITNTVTTTHTTNSVTPVAGLNEVLLGYFFQNINQDDFSAAGSYTLVLNQNESLVSGANLGAIDQLVGSTTGNYTANATTVGTVSSAGYIVTFSASVGGGSSGMPFFRVGP